ncbi:cytochrome b5 [Trametes coccinea BRFM310]|uniref:Cytochrome b5 n=1 Tax=Trametes coccinea (strain BRFM310) TaxID=1353009 RepID=A0A1Y2J169_TRAC3|nr:cytochrome b5 [Trametes coccinea BRFM310]
MASYLRSWLYSQSSTPEPPAAPTIVETAPQEEDDDDDTETVHGDDDDVPPAFPALNSAQRASSSTASAMPRILTDAQRMPPPPLPMANRRPGVASGSSSSSLLPPPTTTKPPPKPSKRNKVALAPGHGPLDWANLKKSGQDLRGTDTLLRVTPSMLKEHRSKDDAWTAINGKVYNVTHYLPYHPGGDKELMRVAGRDGTRLFALTHAWVNADLMLDECLVGFLVSE